MLEIDLFFVTDQSLTFPWSICTGQDTFLTVLVVKLEHIPKLLILIRITEAHDGVAVHKDAVTLVGNDERNRNLGVILEKFLILSLIVEFVCLMLSETVECLIFRRFEYLTERISAGSFNLDRLERLSSSILLLKNHISFSISEPYLTCHCRDISFYR